VQAPGGATRFAARKTINRERRSSSRRLLRFKPPPSSPAELQCRGFGRLDFSFSEQVRKKTLAVVQGKATRTGPFGVLDFRNPCSVSFDTTVRAVRSGILRTWAASPRSISPNLKIDMTRSIARVSSLRSARRSF